MTTSRISGFYQLSLAERLSLLQKNDWLSSDEIALLQDPEALDHLTAANMIENVIGCYSLPLGIALNFVVNQREVLVPMVIEEPSVVAGASFMAKLARSGGGFTSQTDPPEMIGQIQVLDIPDMTQAQHAILEHQTRLLKMVSEIDPILKRLGGGPRDLECRVFNQSPIGAFMVVHLIYDVRDAMGANAVNTAVEKLAPEIETITGGRVNIRILSNLSDRRLARATCTIPLEQLGFDGYQPEQVRDGIVAAWAFAAVDPYRAATHNKGIMNGVDAVVIATGNDWRAVEAGAHSYAARNGSYSSLSTWGIDSQGDLIGSLEMPLAVGIVGGATRVHPIARLALKLMRVSSAVDLAQIIVSVGLAQNLAALRALATEGIQQGHMNLHARQIAIAAGAKEQDIDTLVHQLVTEKNIRIDRAEEILKSKESKIND